MVIGLNDRIAKAVGKALDLGYIEAWFKWLGWTLVSSALFSLGQAANSLWLTLAGLLSFVIVLFLVQVAVERLQDALVEDHKNKLKLWQLFTLMIFGSLAAVIFAHKVVDAIFAARVVSGV